MTREEYKENLVRMFDSLRTDEYKGRSDCKGVKCIHCPFNNKVCNVRTGGEMLFRAYEEATEIIKRWTDEHPIVTNFMKFEEVFGTRPSRRTCVNTSVIKCEDCSYSCHGECAVSKLFWNAEYKEECEE